MRSAPHEGEVQQRKERRRNKGADHREVEKRCHVAHESGNDDNADKGRDRHPDIEVASRALILFHQEAQRLIIGTGILLLFHLRKHITNVPIHADTPVCNFDWAGCFSVIDAGIHCVLICQSHLPKRIFYNDSNFAVAKSLSYS